MNFRPDMRLRAVMSSISRFSKPLDSRRNAEFMRGMRAFEGGVLKRGQACTRTPLSTYLIAFSKTSPTSVLLTRCSQDCLLALLISSLSCSLISSLPLGDGSGTVSLRFDYTQRKRVKLEPTETSPIGTEFGSPSSPPGASSSTTMTKVLVSLL